MLRLKRKVSPARRELDDLVDKICVTASDRLRGWHQSNRSKRYFIDVVDLIEVEGWNGNSSTREERDLRLVVDVDLQDHSEIVAISPHDLYLPLTNQHKKMIGEAFLTGCVRLAAEPLDLELAAELAIPEIEGWLETDKS